MIEIKMAVLGGVGVGKKLFGHSICSESLL